MLSNCLGLYIYFKIRITVVSKRTLNPGLAHIQPVIYSIKQEENICKTGTKQLVVSCLKVTYLAVFLEGSMNNILSFHQCFSTRVLLQGNPGNPGNQVLKMVEQGKHTRQQYFHQTKSKKYFCLGISHKLRCKIIKFAHIVQSFRSFSVKPAQQ